MCRQTYDKRSPAKYLVEFGLLAGRVVAVFPQRAVVTSPLLPLAVVVVGHEQHVVHIPARGTHTHRPCK